MILAQQLHSREDLVYGAAAELGIDLACKLSDEQNQNIMAWIARANELDQHFTITIRANAAHEYELLARTDGKAVRKYTKNLLMYECSKWLAKQEGFDILATLEMHALHLRLVHIHGLDWLTLPRLVEQVLEKLLKRAQAIILEGVGNVPVSFLSSIRDVQSLDLAWVHFAAELPPSTTLPCLQRLAIRGGRSEMTDVFKALAQSPSMPLKGLKSLFLDCLWRKKCVTEIVGICASTLEDLRLNYKPEENGRSDEDLINFGSLPKLRTLYLSVVAGVHSIAMLRGLLVGIPVIQPLELSLFIDDRHGSGWTDEVVSSSIAADWKDVDAKLVQILQGHKATRVSLRLPKGTRTSQDAAEAFIKAALPFVCQTCKRFNLEYAEEDAVRLGEKFSLMWDEVNRSITMIV